MEPGPSSKPAAGGMPEDWPRRRPKPGPWPPPRIEPFVPPSTNHDPTDLKSWARRTGFSANSGESAATRDSGEAALLRQEPDPEKSGFPPKPEITRIDIEKEREREKESKRSEGVGGGGSSGVRVSPVIAPVEVEEAFKRDVDFEFFSEAEEPTGNKPAGLVCGLTENPGYAFAE